MRNRSRNTGLRFNLVVVLIIILIVLGYGFFRFYGFKPLIYFEGFFLKLSSPIAGFFRNMSIGVGSYFGTLFSLTEVKNRSEYLEYHDRVLRLKIAVSENYIEENKRLNKLLDIKKTNNNVVFAEITSRDPMSSNNFIINKGKKSNISIYQAVIYPIDLGSVAVSQKVVYQLLGRVKEVFDTNSKILSILDSESKISARNLRNHSLSTVEYNPVTKKLFLTALKESVDYKNGDLIVTSELSTLPKDLLIGTVYNIESTSSIYAKIYITPSIDFYKITEIAVIIKK
jgi:rod shape-determining protein MreC